MAADDYGNDLGAVGIARSGFIALSFADNPTIPTSEQLLADAIPSGFMYVGLLQQDGGYGEEVSTGDLTNFFQSGYSLVTGEEELTGTFVMSERNAVRTRLSGITNGIRKKLMYTNPIGAIVRTQYRNGSQMNLGGIITLTEVSPSQHANGEIATLEVKFKWQFSQDICGYYRSALVSASTSGC